MVLSKHVYERPAVRFSLISTHNFSHAIVKEIERIFLHEFGEFTLYTPALPGFYTLSFYSQPRFIGIYPPKDIAKKEDATTLRMRRVRAQLKQLCDKETVCAFLEGTIAENGPRLIVTDADSTFIDGEVIEMIAKAANTEDVVRDITLKAMQGKIDFSHSLAHRVETLQGVPTTIFDNIFRSLPYMPGARSLLQTAHSHGISFGIVSGGFLEVLSLVQKDLGIDAITANQLEESNGYLTGKTRGIIIDGQAKKEAVKKWAHVRGIPLSEVLTAGDGANDIEMMSISGLSIAFCAKPMVRQHADVYLPWKRLDAIAALVGWDAIS
ncbi:MAG: phosphoserine phosphatase SerB [Actinomycetaceae bacterium]|nr:phosphoserine phosphatase SerB [Actinomycetaceae bacterium]